jgi:hypothetical protein
MTEILARVRGDLESNSISKMRNTFTEDDWRSRAAKLLNIPSESDWRHVKDLAIVPLQNGQWISIRQSDGPAYFPEISGVAIPADIGLRILDPWFVQNVDMKALFDNLGVQIAGVQTVRSAILRQYQTRSSSSSTDTRRVPGSVFASKSHLQFLYLTDHVGSHSDDDLASLEVFVQDGSLMQPTQSAVYIANNSRYGAADLLRPTHSAPGLEIPFLHEFYLIQQPHKSEQQKMTWVSWLYMSLKVRRRLSIMEANPFNRSSFQLSSTCQYLAKYRRDRLLGFLRFHWKFERDNIRAFPELLTSLRQIPLSDTPGIDVSLGACYLPVTAAKKLVSTYLCPEEHFPWMPLDPEEEFIPSEWDGMMNDLQTGFPRDDIDFGLRILDCVIYGSYGQNDLPSQTGLPRKERIYKLYEYLQYLTHHSADPSDSKKKMRWVYS